jgi:hypothetical protein
MAMDERPVQRWAKSDLRASDADRELVADRLRTAAGHGRITLDELEERLEAVYAAKTYGELVPITADLPVEGDGAARVLDPRPTLEDHVPQIGLTPSHRRTVIAVMSGAKRMGAWVVPQRMRAFAFWGGVVLDLREARYQSGESVIRAFAIMGGVQIIAPEDVYVDVTGIGIMGGFGESRSNAVSKADAPVVRVKGFAFWGGVMVQHVKREKNEERPDELEG